MVKDLFPSVSVRWKLMASFIIVFLVPVCLLRFGVPFWLTLFIGILLTAFFSWYAGSRILGTIDRLLNIAGKQSKSKTANRSDGDELQTLINTFDGIYNELEQKYSNPSKPTPIDLDNTSVEQTLLMPDPSRRISFNATLATGQPAMGDVVIMFDHEQLLNDHQIHITEDDAKELFEQVRTLTLEQLKQLSEYSKLTEDEKGIIEFQELLLHDPALLEGLNVALDEGIELIEAIQETFQGLKKRLQDSQNQYIAARAADCEDLEKRLTTSIISLANPELDDFYDRVHEKIIFCQQILPSEVVMLHRAGVRGIISMKGTASSHAQILMKCFGIPSLSCIENFYYRGMDGVKVLLDTRAHKLIINPKSVDQQILSRSITQFFSDIILEPIHLPNGEAIEVLATINNIELDATRALGMGADGVGLFRSEMTYIGKAELPNENELYAEYFHLTNTFQGKPVTMRMLDLGGDKLAGFQTDDLEENPSMGNRSMRLLLTRKDIFRTQLRAMLRAANDHTCILFPMISGWDELIKIHAFIDKQKEELIDEGYEINPNIQYGLMIEVPSLVEKIEDFVKDYSVFNIGSNDLTQYTLAADRNNRSVSDYYKYSHPSIISMISKVSKVYSQAGKRASMCGEMAYNLELLPLLIGLGIRSFSVSWDHIAELKSAISNINIEVCQKLTVEALNCRTQSEVEQVLGNYNPWPEGY